MKTNLLYTTTLTLNSQITGTYNKVGRGNEITRTNFPVSKQFDFTQSVDYSLVIPQI